MKKEALIIHEHISLEAFLLSEQAGHPAGMDKTFWMQAEAIVHGRTAVVAGAGKALPKAKAKVVAETKPASTGKAAPIKAPSAAKDAVPIKAKAKAASKRTK